MYLQKVFSFRRYVDDNFIRVLIFLGRLLGQLLLYLKVRVDIN